MLLVTQDKKDHEKNFEYSWLTNDMNGLACPAAPNTNKVGAHTSSQERKICPVNISAMNPTWAMMPVAAAIISVSGCHVN